MSVTEVKKIQNRFFWFFICSPFFCVCLSVLSPQRPNSAKKEKPPNCLQPNHFAAPLIFVKKHDGILRVYVDYRELYTITARDRYPLPYINHLLDKLYSFQYFTLLDLSTGYHQLRIHLDDCHKTAIIAPNSIYELLVLPFGLANALAVFMRKMNRILHPHSKYAVVYQDDIMVYSRTRANHVRNVEAVLEGIWKVGMRLNAKKCEFRVP